MTTILMVEDEMNLAMLLEDILDAAGYHVLKAARLPNALQLLEESGMAGRAKIDAAILDVNLAGVLVFPLAAALRARDVPFGFTSGYGRDGIPAEYSDSSVLQKPYSAEKIMSMVQSLAGVPDAAA